MGSGETRAVDSARDSRERSERSTAARSSIRVVVSKPALASRARCPSPYSATVAARSETSWVTSMPISSRRSTSPGPEIATDSIETRPAGGSIPAVSNSAKDRSASEAPARRHACATTSSPGRTAIVACSIEPNEVEAATG